MKLPEEKRDEIEKQGNPKATPHGGGAMGRLRQFEKERGLDKGEGNPAADECDKGKESEDAKD